MKIINKKILLIVGLLIVGLLIVGLFYKFDVFVKKGKENIDKSTFSNNNNENGVFISNNMNEINDTDGDGIPDVEEIKLGTSITDFDTDFDGLQDIMEEKYGTDPTNPDTDGDGFPDGLEIIRGYNPVGEGKLVQ